MDSERFILFPVKHQNAWDLYKQGVDAFWTKEEIDFSEDASDFKHKLDEDEQQFIKNILMFFAASDGVIAENVAAAFYLQTKIPEERLFYGVQIFIEGIHAEVYSRLVELLIDDPEELKLARYAINNVPIIQKKALWTKNWLENPDVAYEYKLVANAAAEGIGFCTSFAGIFWLQNKNEGNLMPGFIYSNEKISLDESLHCEGSCEFFKQRVGLDTDLDLCYKIIGEAVELEKEFARYLLPGPLVGINSDLMEQYAEHVGNVILTRLGLDSRYDVENPFPFMEKIGIAGKSNFHERKVAEYKMTVENQEFLLLDDF